MMLEVFKYTERVVNMVRPRKLLMIAVGMFNVRGEPVGHYNTGERAEREKENLDDFFIFLVKNSFFANVE